MTKALVFGASGYIGTHLVPCLAARGMSVRAAARRRAALEARGWPDTVEIVAADAQQPATLAAALEGVDVAWYLVHSMAAGADFPRLDRQAAENFRDAAAKAGVKRIVYLGGLQPAGDASAHLASRGETGDILRAGPVPVTEVRAGIIIGPGSAAFEVIRDLVFHLPVLLTPRWVRSHSQPIALDNVLEYLARLPDFPEAAGAIYDVGGPEVLTYEQLMRDFAGLVGRSPLIVPVPVLTPQLSSYWLNFVTAVPTNVARALIDGLEHDVLADDAAIRALIPLELRTYRDAARDALALERAGEPGERWTEGSMLYRRNRPDFAFYAKRMGSETTTAAPIAAVWKRDRDDRRRERLLLPRRAVEGPRLPGRADRRHRPRARAPRSAGRGGGRRHRLLARRRGRARAAPDADRRNEAARLGGARVRGRARTRRPHPDRRHRLLPSRRGPRARLLGGAGPRARRAVRGPGARDRRAGRARDGAGRRGRVAPRGEFLGRRRLAHGQRRGPVVQSGPDPGGVTAGRAPRAPVPPSTDWQAW